MQDSKQKLTKKVVECLHRPEKGQVLYWDTELKGFGIRATPNGLTFVVQSRVNGRNRRVKIGAYGPFTVDEARKKAMGYLRDMANGIDPNAEKKRKKVQAVILNDVAQAYIKDRELKESSIRDIKKHLDGIFQPWKKQPITQITRDKVLKKYREKSKCSKAQANQAFRILRALLNYAKASYRTNNEPILPENPCQVISDAKIWNDIAPKNRRIPLNKVGKAWNLLDGMREDPTQTLAGRSIVDGVAFALLTGARWGEVQTLTWDNVNLQAGTWYIKDPKNKQNVTLPLSTQAKILLENLVHYNQFVFGSNKSKTGYIGPARWVTDQLCKALEIEFSAHDLRRTFRAIAAELGIELWKTKMLMNHKLNGDITLQAYTEKEDLEYLRPDIQKIGDWIERQAMIASNNNVIDLEAAQNG